LSPAVFELYDDSSGLGNGPARNLQEENRVKREYANERIDVPLFMGTLFHSPVGTVKWA
jgi:hypothetical protein